MRFIPQSMLGRTLAIVIGCLILLQIAGGVIHYREWQRFTENAERSKLIEHIATYVQWMNSATPIQRELLLRTNRYAGIRAWQSRRSLLRENNDWFGVESFVQDRLASALGDVQKSRIRVDDRPPRFKPSQREDDDHYEHKEHDDDDHYRNKEWQAQKRQLYLERSKRPSLLVSVHLDDGNWLNIKVPFEREAPSRFFPSLLPLTLLTLAIALIASFIVKSANKPLAKMAKAADELGKDVNAPPIEEKGPKEVREAAAAFNRMQIRLRRFVQDRTHMLAAISHDLRTPITRMKLRAEFIDDDELRDKMLNDLDEMETMIAATLAFARDDVAHEDVSQIDLAALVESLCEDMRESGQNVTYSGLEELSFKGRPVGLKRAIGNLVGNAIKYAQGCEVTLTLKEDRIALCVRDDGPGIPEEQLEDVFRPFKRVEESRNKETGGVGLGLAVVRSVAHVHGGTVSLTNRKEGGLEATILLPLA